MKRFPPIGYCIKCLEQVEEYCKDKTGALRPQAYNSLSHISVMPIESVFSAMYAWEEGAIVGPHNGRIIQMRADLFTPMGPRCFDHRKD